MKTCTECGAVSFDDDVVFALEFFEDLRTGFQLLKTNPRDAEVYFDRATKQLGKHLIEVAQCPLL